MRTGSKQVLSVQARRRLDYEIYNYCATCKIKYPKDIFGLQIIESGQQDGIVLKWQIRKGFNLLPYYFVRIYSNIPGFSMRRLREPGMKTLCENSGCFGVQTHITFYIFSYESRSSSMKDLNSSVA